MIREALDRLKYWIFQPGKDCKHCCLWCEYYDICKWDTMTGKTATNEETIEILTMRVAQDKRKDGLLYRIYKYVELKQKERQRREKF